MRRTIEVLLRLRTGAAAPETEVQSYLDQFMPSPFDTQTQAKAKLDAAKTFFAGTGDLFRESRNLPAQGAAAPDEPAADFGGMSNEQFLSVPLTEDNAEAWMEEVERRGLQ